MGQKFTLFGLHWSNQGSLHAKPNRRAWEMRLFTALTLALGCISWKVIAEAQMLLPLCLRLLKSWQEPCPWLQASHYEKNGAARKARSDQSRTNGHGPLQPAKRY